MEFYQNHKALAIFLSTGLFLILLVFIEFLFIKLNGGSVPVPDIPRGNQVIGEGKPVTYTIMGDSTAVGQGGEYSKGIATQTAGFLAKDHKVTWQNLAASGARMADVANSQVNEAMRLKPDIVLISVGANDVTHITKIDSVKKNILKTIKQLRQANPSVKIIITGSPQMGAVPRFPQPVRYIAKLRVESINKMFAEVARAEAIIFAPIALKTGPIFSQNPKLFAADKFHPNNDGYAIWVPVLNEALALSRLD